MASWGLTVQKGPWKETARDRAMVVRGANRHNRYSPRNTYNAPAIKASSNVIAQIPYTRIRDIPSYYYTSMISAYKAADNTPLMPPQMPMNPAQVSPPASDASSRRTSYKSYISQDMASRRPSLLSAKSEYASPYESQLLSTDFEEYYYDETASEYLPSTTPTSSGIDQYMSPYSDIFSNQNPSESSQYLTPAEVSEKLSVVESDQQYLSPGEIEGDFENVDPEGYAEFVKTMKNEVIDDIHTTLKKQDDVIKNLTTRLNELQEVASKSSKSASSKVENLELQVLKNRIEHLQQFSTTLELEDMVEQNRNMLASIQEELNFKDRLDALRPLQTNTLDIRTMEKIVDENNQKIAEYLGQVVEAAPHLGDNQVLQNVYALLDNHAGEIVRTREIVERELLDIRAQIAQQYVLEQSGQIYEMDFEQAQLYNQTIEAGRIENNNPVVTDNIYREVFGGDSSLSSLSSSRTSMSLDTHKTNPKTHDTFGSIADRIEKNKNMIRSDSEYIPSSSSKSSGSKKKPPPVPKKPSRLAAPKVPPRRKSSIATNLSDLIGPATSSKSSRSKRGSNASYGNPNSGSI